MIATILLTSLLVAEIPSPPPAVLAVACTAPQGKDGKPLKALDSWMKLYKKGKIEFHSKKDIRKDSFAEKYNLTDKNGLGDATWAGDLDVILEHVAKLDDAEAAEALANVAATGMDDATYTFEMAPYDVRVAGEKWLAKLTSGPAKDALAAGGKGEWKPERGRTHAVRAAALRGLGLLKDASARPVLVGALADANELVRLTAAEALGMIGGEESAEPLIGVLEREQNDPVLLAAARSLRDIYSKFLPAAGEKVDPSKIPASVRLAVRAAIAALGRTSWRADMALVRLLDDFRSAESVPALIAILERFRDHPDDVRSGKLSGLLMGQVHELLVSMTGAVFPATAADKWRELWERDKDKIDVSEKRAPDQSGHTVSTGFAGIPVEGTRVVFVLDLSGSMDWPMEEPDPKKKGEKLKRIDFAKRELSRVVDELATNAMFTLISFNGDREAEVWSKELVQATEKNRERFKKHVEKMKPNGGTNLWSGMEKALTIKSLVYGNQYETNVDEVFVLSDGAPTVGEVTDPIEILRLVEEANRFATARINAVFINSATPPEYLQSQPKMSITPSDLMRRMAEQNGGKFREL